MKVCKHCGGEIKSVGMEDESWDICQECGAVESAIDEEENLCPVSQLPCEEYQDCHNRVYCHLK